MKPVRLSQQNSFKVRRAGLSPLDLEQLAEYNRKNRKSRDLDNSDDTGRKSILFCDWEKENNFFNRERIEERKEFKKIEGC